MSLARKLVVLVLAGGALAAAASVLVPGWLLRREHQLVLRRTADVVTAIRDLARLETTEYHMEKVIDLRDRQSRLYGLVEGEDALLLVASGEVSAGVDLSRLGPADVRLDAARATVRLPAPEIFHVRLDEGRTYVYSRHTDLLATRNERLEGQAREQAVRSFEDAARVGGILDRARAQAERVVRALCRQLGPREVVVEWR